MWIAGIVLLGAGIWRAQAPFTRMTELDRLAENSRRYDSWRGGRAPTAADETTGADVMRAMLRRQVLMWSVIGLVGVALIIAGFAVR